MRTTYTTARFRIVWEWMRLRRRRDVVPCPLGRRVRPKSGVTGLNRGDFRSDPAPARKAISGRPPREFRWCFRTVRWMTRNFLRRKLPRRGFEFFINSQPGPSAAVHFHDVVSTSPPCSSARNGWISVTTSG